MEGSLGRPRRTAAARALITVKDMAGNREEGFGQKSSVGNGKRKKDGGINASKGLEDSSFVLPKTVGQQGVPKARTILGMKGGKRLGPDFFDKDCIELCHALLGTVLCRKMSSTGEILRGTIVETEAYPGRTDKASQSFKGKTPRNEAMFMAPGTAYVYMTYGMYYCFNISSRGEGAACLIRAAEPLEDYETMQRFRNRGSTKKKTVQGSALKDNAKLKKFNVYELANGPSKLCLSFDIDRDRCDKMDLSISEEMWLEESQDPYFINREFEVAIGKRIGIDSTPPEYRDKPWRFYVKDNWAESRAKIGELKKKAKRQKVFLDEQSNNLSNG